MANKVKRTWIEKRDCDKSLKIKTIDKKFADIPEGSKMFIATPQIIDEYVKHIPFGKSTELSTMRNDLAIEYQADKTCPVTTGIFLRIVSEASFEELKAGNDIEEVYKNLSYSEEPGYSPAMQSSSTVW